MKDVVQASLYEWVDPERRSAAHREIAAGLQTVGTGTLVDIAITARHLIRGGRPEEAEPLKNALAIEARQWEHPSAAPWIEWPDDLRSGLLLDSTLPQV